MRQRIAIRLLFILYIAGVLYLCFGHFDNTPSVPLTLWGIPTDKVVHFAMFFAVVAWFTPLIIFGEGFCALISAWLLNSILISVSGTPEDAEQEALPETAEDTKPETEEEQP